MTRKIRLISSEGTEMGVIEINDNPDSILGPDVIIRGDETFIRKTYGVYQQATCYVV